MRPYNSDADYHILEEVAKKEKTLTAVAFALQFHGIEWPKDFNSNSNGKDTRSEATKVLDRDICRSWGR